MQLESITQRAVPAVSMAVNSSSGGGGSDGGGAADSSSTTAGGAANSSGQGWVPWHLDRLDQRSLPLDGQYTATATGTGVNIYVVSSVSCGSFLRCVGFFQRCIYRFLAQGRAQGSQTSHPAALVLPGAVREGRPRGVWLFGCLPVFTMKLVLNLGCCAHFMQGVRADHEEFGYLDGSPRSRVRPAWGYLGNEPADDCEDAVLWFGYGT